MSRDVKKQNAFLLVASYVFYGWWDWRFLVLKALSSLFGFVAGYWIGKTDSTKKRKIVLSFSIVSNLLFLGVFKYYNFFVSSFTDLFSVMGFKR